MFKTALLALFAFIASAQAGLAYNKVYYDFANGCEGLGPSPVGPIRTNGIVSYGGEIYVLMALIPTILKISPDGDGIPACSVYGTINWGMGTGPNPDFVPFGTFNLGMQADPSGNIYLTNTGTGPTTSDHGSIWVFPVDAVEQPIKGVRIASASATLSFPSGIDVDWRHNRLLFTSELDGIVYSLDLYDNTISVWADIPELKGFGRSPGNEADAGLTNTNLLAFPIGATGIRIANNGESVDIGSGDQGLVIRIAIHDQTGNAGAISVVGSAPHYTVEGIANVPNDKKLYFTTVFANGTNLTPNSESGEYQGGVLPGRTIWETVVATGVSTPYYDAHLSMPTGIVSGRGVVPAGIKRMLVVESGFGSMPFWPLGQVRNDVVRAPYPAALGSTTGPAFPNEPYACKVLLFNIV